MNRTNYSVKVKTFATVQSLKYKLNPQKIHTPLISVGGY